MQRLLSVFVNIEVPLFSRDIGYETWIVIVSPILGKNSFSYLQ
jgi:hypothetical protein